jgi:RNA polymerase sigma factor (sigma-70 family)
MDLEPLVRRAAQGDVKAFVELTERFQHFAFGSALALVGDFQQAEDVVQEAFLAAWRALPSLAEPAAFPGWLRSIVRRQAGRVLRRAQLQMVPLAAAENVPAEQVDPDEQLAARQRSAAVLAAIAELPPRLREPATLFYLHDCSQQDIAAFLELPLATVNNRLHAARRRLKERMLAMMTEALRSHGLPDDFAHRIGRLVDARDVVVDALFDPQSLPDLLSELAVSDEANRRLVTVQVIQRPGGGIVRAVVLSSTDGLPVDAPPRGTAVLNALRRSETPVDRAVLERILPLLVEPKEGESPRILETGIKAIDVMCPLIAGGTVAIAGEFGAGATVVMEELVRRLNAGADGISLFTLLAPWPGEREPGYSLADALKQEGFSEGTVGAVQTFFFRGQDGPWTPEQLEGLRPVDTVIHLSREMAKAKIYPCVDVCTSRSRLLEEGHAGERHALVASRVRHAMDLVWDRRRAAAAEPVAVDRAHRLAQFFGQPFFCAEPWTKRPGASVSLVESLLACEEILDGIHDDLPIDAFSFAGSMAEIRDRARSRS